MKKKILYSSGVMAVAAVLILALKLGGPKVSPETNPEPNREQNEQSEAIMPDLPEQTLPFSNDPKTLAWNLFQKYLSYNQKLDLNGVKSLVHKVSAVCENEVAGKDCLDRMGRAYYFGSQLKKDDFVNIWSDEKQTILSTDFHTEENDESIGRFRSIIFFIKDSNGKLKLLSFSPVQGGATARGAASQEELEDRILTWTEDKDNDGVSDYSEECLDAINKETCVKTSPKLRDSDLDGLWDGTEFYLSQN